MTIYVDYTALDQAAKNFATRQEHLVSILENLEAGLAPMLASWEGSARDLYVEKKATWDKAANDLAALLSSIQQHTQKAHDGYADLVASSKSAWEA